MTTLIVSYRRGLRIIYFYFESEQQIWLMTLYDKSEAADLTAQQKKMLAAAIAAELKARAERRPARSGRGGRKRQ